MNKPEIIRGAVYKLKQMATLRKPNYDLPPDGILESVVDDIYKLIDSQNEIKSISKTSINDSDIIVITIARNFMHAEAHENCHKELKKVFPNNEVLILEKDSSISVIDKEEDALNGRR